MDKQDSFPLDNMSRPKYMDVNYNAETQKALDALARFQASRFVVYGKAPGHKKFHPMAPSRGLYNCSLVYQERYIDQATAQGVAEILTKDNPDWSFQVRTIKKRRKI